MKYTIEVPNMVGSSYTREYEKTELYCPFCAKQTVYVETGIGDYYQGSQYLCISCDSSHYLDLSSDRKEKKFDLLREAIGSVLNHYRIGM